MEEQGKPRELIRLMYGEQAEAMNEVAGERLRRWAQAFDEWLGKMAGKTGLRLRKEARLSWRYFTQSYRGAPWAASTDDVERWMEQLLQRGLGIITVRQHLRNASLFYQFMGENGRDPELGAGYNPVTGVRTPQWRPYRNASTLSPEAAQALLKAVDRESTITGKRDYAMILMALRTGLESEHIRQLKWENLREEPDGQRLAGEGIPQAQVPGDAWQAILDYLGAAGRLAGIRPEEYVFAPASDPLFRIPDGSAADWDGSHPISRGQVRMILKRTAQRAKLDASRITWLSLRHTAILLKIEAGIEIEEVKQITGMASVKKAKYYVNHITQGHEVTRHGVTGCHEARCTGQEAQRRENPGSRHLLKHGYYAKRIPPEELSDLEANPRQGLDEEIDLLRFVMRKALGLIMEAETHEETVHAIDVLCKIATRLSLMTKAEHEINPQPNPMNQALSKVLHDLAVENHWVSMPNSMKNETWSSG